MKVKSLLSKVKPALIVVCSVILFTSCEKDQAEDAPAEQQTMGDPKSSSPGASRCFEITQFTDDGENETSDYANIRLEFFNGGTVIARSSAQEWTGQWSFGSDDGVPKLFLNFQGTTPLLNELTDDWNIISLGNTPSFIEDDDSTPDFLELTESGCEPGPPPNPALTAFNDNLVGESWSISSFIDDGDDETNLYNNASFTFNSNGSVTVMRNNQQRNGQWSTSIDNGQIELTIFYNGGPNALLELNEDWDVISSTSTEIQLVDDDEDDDFLTFSRN
jgi:hypothetical protein